MSIEEVYRKDGKGIWRGQTSGKEYKDHEVSDSVGNMGFGNHYGGWSEDFSEDMPANPSPDGLVSPVKGKK